MPADFLSIGDVNGWERHDQRRHGPSESAGRKWSGRRQRERDTLAGVVGVGGIRRDWIVIVQYTGQMPGVASSTRFWSGSRK